MSCPMLLRLIMAMTLPWGLAWPLSEMEVICGFFVLAAFTVRQNFDYGLFRFTRLLAALGNQRQAPLDRAARRSILGSVCDHASCFRPLWLERTAGAGLSPRRRQPFPLVIGVIGGSPEIYALALSTTVEKIPEVWERAQRHPIDPISVSNWPVQGNHFARRRS